MTKDVAKLLIALSVGAVALAGCDRQDNRSPGSTPSKPGSSAPMSPRADSGPASSSSSSATTPTPPPSSQAPSSSSSSSSATPSTAPQSEPKKEDSSSKQ